MPLEGMPAAMKVMKTIRLAIVTNIPAPYRVPILNLLAAETGVELKVFYAAEREPGRKWDLPPLEHPHLFLTGRMLKRRVGDVVHNNPQVFGALRHFKPDVVFTIGFNPTHLYAFAYARLFRRAHVAMTDGTLMSEAGLSGLHRFVRRVVYGRTEAFVAASQAGAALFKSYGAADERIFMSPLCANTSVAWQGVSAHAPGIDLLFSGRLIDIKNPLFALAVAKGVALRLGRRVKLAVLGSGSLEGALREQAELDRNEVDLVMAGHASQAEIPGWFAGASVFLFPSSWDPWGVVANEACHAGVPTVISPAAGAAGELILDGVNGYVRPLELSAWVDVATALISNPVLRRQMSENALRQVAPYSFENAASGLLKAARLAVSLRE